MMDPARARGGRGGRGGQVFSAPAAVLLAAVLFLVAPAAAGADQAGHLLRIDLREISRRMDLLYRWAETEEVPAGHILIGDEQGARFMRPGPLELPSDLRRRVSEFDPLTGTVFVYRVPAGERFVGREEREGVYFVTTPRPLDIEGLEIDVLEIDALAADIRRRSLRQVWLDDLAYALTRVTADVRGRGRLIDISIPISLPRQLEAIFGRGEETRLTVSGRERITVGGTSRWCANCPQTEGMPRQQRFPDLDMQQQLTVNLHGTIGEKINVAIDHSSMGGGAPSVNRVRLNYTGFDDEIIKLVEMGDTDMTLTGAQLISHSGQARGLFGVKTVAQIGPLDLTVVASKEEGESSSGTFSSSGGQATERTINDYEYIKRQFFYLETPGEDFSAPTPGFGQYYPVIGGTANDSLEVFASLRVDTEWRINTRPKLYVRAWTDPNNDGSFDDGEMFQQWFYPLYEGVDYELIQDYGAPGAAPRYIGLRLRRPLRADQALAVRYRLQRTQDVVTVGDYGNYPATPIDPPPQPDEFITAELLCPPEDDFAPPGTEGAKYTSTWHMMFRNVYSLGVSGVEDAALDVKIRAVGTVIGTAEIHPPTGERYLRIFGLDRYQGTGAWGPDGFVDVRQGVINFHHGYIMFPSPQPFSPTRGELRTIFDTRGPPNYAPSDSVDAFVDLLDETLQRNQSIYDEILDRFSPPNYYEIVIESSTGSRVFNLGAFDILEGTESVAVDGVRLTRGVDYDIDYFGGVVTLKGEYGNLPPDASVRIDYQHKPLFGGGRSSLVGVGGNLNLSRNARLNATFLYNSVGAPKYLPRLGEEPTRMMAADINGSFQFEPRWMTSIANLLPRVDTNARSSLNLTGEVAVSFPNPNTKGEAYIDDMEGIEDSDQVQLVRSMWYEASPPIDPAFPSTTLPAWPDGMEFYWYNPANTNRQQFLTTSRKDLNPKLDDRENSRQVSMFLKAINPGPEQWAGIMTGFAGGIDLSRAQYLEIWVNDYTPDPDERRGILRVDFGRIDEDFHQPDLNRFDAENLTTWTIADDIGFPGDDPTRRFNGDFSDDKWDPERRIYRWINSRIGNSRPDSEDLNKNGRLDEVNEYYSLMIDLADSAIIDVQRDFADVSSYWEDPEKGWINRRKSWRLYRIDMRNAELPSGIASRLDRVQHMRVWIENIDEISALSEPGKPAEHMLEITGLKFVGSRWEFNHIRDLADNERPVPAPGLGTPDEMKVRIGAINNKDNPSIYIPPRELEKEDGIEIREQSLLFDIENFETGYSFRVMKRFFGQGADFNQYREIQFFLRPDQQLVSGVDEGLEFFMQVAYDSLNYYEIAVPLGEADRNRWRWSNVLLSDLTNLKIGAAPGQPVEREITDVVDPARRYRARVVGDPTLFRVRFVFAGLRNQTGMRIPQGQMWFNDITLGRVRKDIDHAERLSAAANFANVASFNVSYQRTGPEFRSLRQKTGSGATNHSLALAGKTEINHIIPTARFSLPVTARYSSSQSEPKYLPQSDVEIIDREERELRRTVRNTYAYSISLSRSGSRNFIMKNVFDNLRAGYSYSRNQMYSPTALDTSWSQSWNANYQITFRRERRLRLPRGIQLRYWPTSFSYNASGAKSVRTTYSLSQGEFRKNPVGISHGWDNEIQTSYDPFESLRLSYRRSEKRDVLAHRDWYGLPVGKLMTYRQSLDLQYQPRGRVWFISQFNPRFEYGARYEEDLNPSVRRGDDPEDTRNVNNSRIMNIVFDVDIGRYVFALGKRSGIIPAEERTIISRQEQRAGMERRKEEFRQRIQEGQPPPPQPEQDMTPEKIPGLDAPQPPDTTGQVAAPADQRRPRGAFSDLLERRPPPAVRTAPEEPEAPEAPADTVDAADRTDPLLLLRHAFRLMGKTKPVRSSIRIDDRSSYQRLYERADWKYRYALSNESGVIGSSCGELICEPENTPLRSAHRIAYDLRSGMDLTANLSLDARFNYALRSEEADGRGTEVRDMTWPDLAFSLRGLEKWGPLEGYVRQSNLTLGYMRRTSTGLGFERSDVAITPSWSLTWINTLATNLSFTYSRQDRVEKNQESWNRTWSANVELRYDIKGGQGFGLPGGRRISFESTLTTALNIQYSLAENHNTPGSTMLAVAPRFTYTFSRNVSGSLAANYRRSAGGIYGYVNHEIGLHATAEFRF